MKRAERIVRSLIKSNLSLEDLNFLIIMISECEEYNEEYGYPASAREANIICNGLYDHCKRNGFYKGI